MLQSACLYILKLLWDQQCRRSSWRMKTVFHVLLLRPKFNMLCGHGSGIITKNTDSERDKWLSAQNAHVLLCTWTSRCWCSFGCHRQKIHHVTYCVHQRTAYGPRSMRHHFELPVSQLNCIASPLLHAAAYIGLNRFAGRQSSGRQTKCATDDWATRFGQLSDTCVNNDSLEASTSLAHIQCRAYVAANYIFRENSRKISSLVCLVIFREDYFWIRYVSSTPTSGFYTARQSIALQALYMLRQIRPSVRPSVCLSVRLSVRYTPVLCQNEGTQDVPPNTITVKQCLHLKNIISLSST